MRQSEGKPGSNDSSVRPLLRPSPPSSLPLPLHPSLLLSIPPHPSLLLHSGPPCGAGRGRTTASGPCAWHRAPSTKLQALSTTTAALSAAENNPQRCTHTSDTHGARTHPPDALGHTKPHWCTLTLAHTPRVAHARTPLVTHGSTAVPIPTILTVPLPCWSFHPWQRVICVQAENKHFILNCNTL